MIKNINLLVLGFLSLFFVACSSNTNVQKEQLKPNVSLTNTYWKAISFFDKEVKVFRKEAHIKFQKDGRVIGNLGCNNFFGQFNQNDENIEFSKVASTKMMCPNIKTEDAFAKVLSGVKTFKIKGESMSFFDKENKEIASFKAVYF